MLPEFPTALRVADSLLRGAGVGLRIIADSIAVPGSAMRIAETGRIC